jgi:hypothetical protein
MKRLHKLAVAVAMVAAILIGRTAQAEYQETAHKPLPPGAIAVTKAGACDQPGKTYVLMQDLRADGTGLALAGGVTLDLNGYTLTYAGAKYEHVPNYGFEQGLAEWDVSRAPGAKVEDADQVKPFIGHKILRLKAGDEIVSKYITLPVADRSYYAQCGVLDPQAKVTISVDKEGGEPVRCEFRWGDNVRPSCPQSGSPKLGGGFVFAHLHGLPAGKYRIRVRADTDALIDEVDLRPALDAGLAIVDKILPWAYYKCILDGDACAFFDLARPGSGGAEPLPWVPRVKGAVAITVRNGVLRSGFEGIRSWAVQSTAADAAVVLENVRVVAAGINTNAVNVPRATIRNCRFEIDTPFIIDRHRLEDSVVALTAADGSEVSGCEFRGGQGCLMVSGKKGVRIHDNLFANRQTVTNHYGLMLGASEGAKVYANRFEPEIGSGILMYSSGANEIYENTFTITAAGPSCEYTHEDYSTNAIRITDYNAKSDPAHPAVGNRIYKNKFRIIGRHYAGFAHYLPIATAVFVSVGAATNRIEDNDVTVEQKDPGTPAVATAFYIGGSDKGGEYLRNRIATHTPAFWIATPYGAAAGVRIAENTIVKSAGAPADFKPFRLGWGKYAATDIEFAGNRFEGCEFGVQATDAPHRYTRK